MTTSDNSRITPYANSTRDNFLNWKRTVDAQLSKRDILTITNEPSKIPKLTELKLRAQCKSVGMTYDANEFIPEFNSQIYHIIVETVSDKTTRQTIERLFQSSNDGKGAYLQICNMWAVDNAAKEAREAAKDTERSNLIRDGAKSGSLSHVTAFVETLLDFNTELLGSDYDMKDAVTVNHVLNALQKHNNPFVQGYKGRYAGTTDWNKNFDKVWTDLKVSLEANDASETANAARETADVLHTKIIDTSFEDRIAAAVIKKLGISTSGDDKRILRTSTWPLCTDCGFQHPHDKEVGCIGKAVSTGKMSVADGEKKLKHLGNPAIALKSAVRRYDEHHPKNDSNAKITPTKKFILATGVVGHKNVEGELATLEVDTKADITILNDPAYFLDGIDPAQAVSLTTISSVDNPPRTEGVGNATVITSDGTELILTNAHLKRDATANILATKPIHDKAIPDLETGCTNFFKWRSNSI